jgi:uncharacterized protein
MKIILESERQAVTDSISQKGYAIIPALLSKPECEHFIAHYTHEDLYRSTINMQRYRFGKGEYKYYCYPLPPIIQELRETLYTALVPLANKWMDQLSSDQLSSTVRYPQQHKEFVEQCHSQKQLRPTPLILRYTEGGYNTLHQDLYGEVFFPIQVVCALSQPGTEYEGGELVITESLPRAQSKATVVRLQQGDAAVITTNFRPVQGTRGYYKVKVKHGVSEVTRGERYALGIIFHDAV